MLLLLLSGRRPVRGRRRVDDGVVDEAGGADARRHGHYYPAVDGRDRLEAVGVDEGEVLGLDVAHRGAGLPGDAGGVALAAGSSLLRGEQGAGERERALTLVGAQAGVAAGEREAV